ncbi:sulfatase-like hydrolase/transferase [Halogeometricum sp. S1BR25-6]|uniref:Sulfatase-like hydrolase/transferase n=1 Tax=Halogeometricum salsisoli TaxID=2950536 RepID=A0ABU2GHI0_9EURY|nr:sulfatase-like hydrolase/transferase [Halogeometricum sp. S1BR25-6]MDS0300287.1 sulfatase-like hydrolase/transferase [Halogeometricum sp. S1BR25-6]
MTRNVALIILDSVRKDHFDEYAPRIQSIADVSFEQCRAASSCSVPSHGSILTGDLPHESGVTYTKVRYDGISRSDTFLDSLPDHRTFGVSANVWASTEFGFGDYFDDFVNISPYRRFQDGMDVKRFALSECDATGVDLYLEYLKTALRRDNSLQSFANGLFAQVDQWLSKSSLPKPLDDGASTICREISKRTDDSSQPFFFFTNFMDAHGPMHHVIGYDKSIHDVPNSWSSLSFDHLDEVTYNIDGAVDTYDEFVSNYRQLYAASIDYLDRKVANLIADVQAATEHETTFIITADHGENLGYAPEDHLFGHTSSLSEALLHVPLYIVNAPEGSYDEEEHELFSHLELGELIASLADGEAADVFRETVPAELIGRDRDEVKELASEDLFEFHSRSQRCAIADEEKLVWDSLGETAKYRLDRTRPNWQEHVADDIQIPEWATEHFSVDLNEYRAAIELEERKAERDDVDEHTKDRLEELGYL